MKENRLPTMLSVWPWKIDNKEKQFKQYINYLALQYIDSELT